MLPEPFVFWVARSLQSAAKPSQPLIDSRDPDVYPRNRIVFFRIQESVVNEIARLCVV
jgi:hypothetical protein